MSRMRMAMACVVLLAGCGSRTGATDFDPMFDDGTCRVGNWDDTSPECECGEYQNKAWSNRVHAGCRVLGCENERVPPPGEVCVVDTCCAYGSRLQ